MNGRSYMWADGEWACESVGGRTGGGEGILAMGERIFVYMG